MRRLLAISAVLFVVVGTLWLGGAFASNVAPPQPAASRPVEGFDGIPFEAMDPNPPACPATFAVCSDVVGKSCRIGTGSACTITNTHDNRCTQQDQSIFECPAGKKIHIQNCPCEVRLQETCCDNCGSYTCGSCDAQPGGQTWFCD